MTKTITLMSILRTNKKINNIAEARKKSNILAKTVEKIRISLGKYTCLIREAFSTRALVDAEIDVSKNIQGRSPTNRNTE